MSKTEFVIALSVAVMWAACVAYSFCLVFCKGF
jgi:hypothetical protein